MSNRYQEALAAYAAGAPVRLVTSMGSCQCGDTEAIMQGGVVECNGRYAWQNYSGPVEGCRVGYGMAELVKAIHEGVEQRPSTQSTGVSKRQDWPKKGEAVIMATAIRRRLSDGSADCSILRRVALVWGVLRWEDTNERGNVPEAFGVRNTRELLPVPEGWVGVELA